MEKNIENKLIECHILLSEALKGYEDRAYISNKLFEIRQYRNKLTKQNTAIKTENCLQWGEMCYNDK